MYSTHFPEFLMVTIFFIFLCLPEQGAVSTGPGPAPGQGRGHREVVHAQGWGLSPGLLGICQWTGGAVAWSLLLIHLPG